MDPMTMDQIRAMLAQYLQAQLFYAALDLDLFSHLDTKKSAQKLAEELGYDPTNLQWTLRSLASEGYLSFDGASYENTEELKDYLSIHGRTYIGDYLKQRLKMMDLSHLPRCVREGSVPKEVAYEAFDFAAVAQASKNDIRYFRAPQLISQIKTLFDEEDSLHFLDLGGGIGALSVEILKAFPHARGTLFEEPSVAASAKKFLEDEYPSLALEIREGNFLVDHIGEGYDLIIASGIFHFAKASLTSFLKKIHGALQEDGKLLSVTMTASDDYLEPRGMVTRWLAGHVRGIDALLTTSQLQTSLDEAGFVEIQPSSTATKVFGKA